MGEIIVREDGTLDLGSFASLSKDELQAWVEARLHGQDTQAPGDARQGELPHYLIARIYPDLGHHIRDDLIQIVRVLLRDMSRNEASTWSGEAAHALLLLAQALGNRTLVAPIREMAEDGRFLDDDHRHDLHRRLLQSLAALGWRGTRVFWDEQVAHDSVRYAGVAFAGLTRIALPHAMDLLPRLPWDDEDVQDQMRVALRGLLPAYDHSEIGALLSDVLPKLSVPVQNMIRDFLPEVSDFIGPGSWWNRAEIADFLQGCGYNTEPTRPALAMANGTL